MQLLARFMHMFLESLHFHFFRISSRSTHLALFLRQQQTNHPSERAQKWNAHQSVWRTSSFYVIKPALWTIWRYRGGLKTAS